MRHKSAIMKETEETEDFITACHYFSKTTSYVSSFKSNEYETIRISNVAFLAVLIFNVAYSVPECNHSNNHLEKSVFKEETFMFTSEFIG